ncbi:hypothetical protein [Candidatus Villigracilis affinis]|uniref:hypothetical protein n=1 Tax=Candidatus Villigracilis affinis TaxID=3140682 RepID=UPI001D59DA6D|nr:hypothetical protein [Anaerolineales bacterium]
MLIASEWRFYIDARGNGTHNSAVTGNTIRQCFDRGILTEAGDGDSVLNLTVQSNIIDQQVDAGAREAIQTNFGITSTNVFGNVDTNNVCLQLGGAGGLANTFSHGGGAPDDFRLRKRQEPTVRFLVMEVALTKQQVRWRKWWLSSRVKILAVLVNRGAHQQAEQAAAIQVEQLVTANSNGS